MSEPTFRERHPDPVRQGEDFRPWASRLLPSLLQADAVSEPAGIGEQQECDVDVDAAATAAHDLAVELADAVARSLASIRAAWAVDAALVARELARRLGAMLDTLHLEAALDDAALHHRVVGLLDAMADAHQPRRLRVGGQALHAALRRWMDGTKTAGPLDGLDLVLDAALAPGDLRLDAGDGFAEDLISARRKALAQACAENVP